MTDSSERSLISFVMLTYNQEKLIEEAMEGAFSQTYQPMEILISDDHSTDRTYEVIERVAASYDGPHQLKTWKNRTNLGVAENFNKAMEASSGAILVLAAGDDISAPDRVERTAQAFAAEGVSLVHSSVNRIDENGRPVSGSETNALLMSPHSIYDVAKSTSLYIGATGAIRRALFEKYGRIEHDEAIEDLVYGFRAALEGGSKYIDAPLVRYRVGTGLSTTVSDLEEAHIEKDKGQNSLSTRIDVFKQRLADIKKSDVAGAYRLAWEVRLKLFRLIGKKAILKVTPYSVLNVFRRRRAMSRKS